MATIILPDHQLIRHPEIVTPRRRVPLFFAEGGFSTVRGDCMHIVFYEHRLPGPAVELVNVVMGRAGFERSMMIEAIEFMPKLFGHHTH